MQTGTYNAHDGAQPKVSPITCFVYVLRTWVATEFAFAERSVASDTGLAELADMAQAWVQLSFDVVRPRLRHIPPREAAEVRDLLNHVIHRLNVRARATGLDIAATFGGFYPLDELMSALALAAGGMFYLPPA